MSVISVLRHNGRVFMAADSMSTDQAGMIWDGSGKIFEKILEDGTRLICGCTGNISTGALFQFDKHTKAGPEKTDDQEWYQALAMHLTALCHECREVQSDGDVPLSLFVACGPDIFEIGPNYAQPIEHYAAIGSGGLVAMGALWNELERFGGYYRPADDEVAQTIVDRAVRAACRWERSCREPVNFLAT